MILLGHGTVYGEQYFTVAPPLASPSWREMTEWCRDTFGETEGSIWGDKIPEPLARWYANNAKFWFRSEADRTWFVLRWS